MQKFTLPALASRRGLGKYPPSLRTLQVGPLLSQGRGSEQEGFPSGHLLMVTLAVVVNISGGSISNNTATYEGGGIYKDTAR